MELYCIEDHIPESTPGLEYPLSNPWIYWVQAYRSKNQPNGSYQLSPKIKFSTIAGFWSFINFFDIAKHTRIIFMREGVAPAWEDPKHRGCGHYIIKFKSDIDMTEIFLNCMMWLIGETFCNEQYDTSLKITGITVVNTIRIKEIRFWTSTPDILDHTKISAKCLDYFHEIGINLSEVSYYITYADLEERSSKTKSYNALDNRSPSESSRIESAPNLRVSFAKVNDYRYYAKQSNSSPTTPRKQKLEQSESEPD